MIRNCKVCGASYKTCYSCEKERSWRLHTDTPEHYYIWTVLMGYQASLRHFFTTSLAKANLPDSVIKTIIGWESLEMVDIYKDIDDEDEIGKYCMNGEIVGQKQAALSDL